MATEDHPAKFTDAILDEAYEMLLRNHSVAYGTRLYDPFGGVGKGVDFMRDRGLDAVGTELEPEWGACSPNVLIGDSLGYMRNWIAAGDYRPHIVFTSPCYGNRMADHHEAKDPCKRCEGEGCKRCKGSGLSRRNTYHHRLGRALSKGSAAEMQWGDEYRAFHAEAWSLVYHLLPPGGFFLLNIKDHIRKGERQYVSLWHEGAATHLGFELVDHTFVPTPGQRNGANAHLRVDGEWLLLFQRPV